MAAFLELKEVLSWRVERIRQDTVAMAWLVLRMVLDPPGPERTAIIERLLQVFAWDPTPAVRRAMPVEVVALLDSPEPEVRYLAARLVDARETPAAIPGLRRGLGDADYMVRRTCIHALGAARPPPDVLIPHLRSERAVERAAALELIASPPPELLRRELWRLLADPEVAVRHRAAEKLGRDLEAPGLWEVTLDMARTETGPRRGYAFLQLHALGLRPEAFPVLLEALRSDPDTYVGGCAVRALAAHAPTVPEVAEALVLALKGGVGVAAAQALGTRGDTTEHVLPRLLTVLEDPEIPEETRGAVALTLARLGASEAVPVLLRLLAVPDRVTREYGSETDTVWVSRLKFDGVRALGELGTRAQEALPVLRAKAREGGAQLYEFRLEAARALVLLGTAPSEVRSLLEDLRLSGSRGMQLLEMYGIPLD